MTAATFSWISFTAKATIILVLDRKQSAVVWWPGYRVEWVLPCLCLNQHDGCSWLYLCGMHHRKVVENRHHDNMLVQIDDCLIEFQKPTKLAEENISGQGSSEANCATPQHLLGLA